MPMPCKQIMKKISEKDLTDYLSFLSDLGLLQQFLALAALTVSGYNNTRAPKARTGRLDVMRISETDADKPAGFGGLIDKRPVNRVDRKTHHVAPIRRDRDSVFQVVIIGRQVWGARPVIRFRDMLQSTVFVRTPEVTDLTVVGVCVVKMHERVNIAPIRMRVKGMILVHILTTYETL